MSEIPTTTVELGNVIIQVIQKIDVLLGTPSIIGSPDEPKLAEIRAKLDQQHRALVAGTLASGTATYIDLATSLSTINGSLQTTIDDVNKTAQTLEDLVELADVFGRIIELAVSVA